MKVDLRVAADAEEAISLRRYRDLRRGRGRRDRTAVLAVGSLLCFLQVVIVLISGAAEQPLVAAVTLAICLGLLLLLTYSPSAKTRGDRRVEYRSKGRQDELPTHRMQVPGRRGSAVLQRVLPRAFD